MKEKSTRETKKFVQGLEEVMGFPIHTIQCDNGLEFVHDEDRTNKKIPFEKALIEMHINLKRIPPYSP